MKKLILASILAVLFSCNVASAADGKWDGFRGATWGMDANDVNDPNFVQVSRSKDGILTQYRTSSDTLKIGRANLKSITYTFYKNRLLSVTVKTINSGGAALKSAVFAHYGEGHQANQFIDAWSWFSTHTGGKVQMRLEAELFNDESTLSIYGLVVLRQLWADADTKDKEAGSDF